MPCEELQRAQLRVFWYYILRSELDTALEKRERVTVY
jgi:hypothetical protein